MAKLYNPFWVGLTVVLCVVFVVLFLPPTRARYGLGLSILFTAIGVAVIWSVYFIRAHIFARVFGGEGKNRKMTD